MSFKLLKQVISHLRKSTKCPACSGQFTDDSIFVLGTSVFSPNGSSGGLFYLICPKCGNQAFVMVEAASVNLSIKQNLIRVQTKKSPRNISTNEILDMHNFLKTWKGDVKELFNEI